MIPFISRSIKMYTVLFVLMSVYHVDSERILLLTPMATRSHENIFNSVAKVLLNEGHEVTIVSPGFKHVAGTRHVNTSEFMSSLLSQSYSTFMKDIFEGSRSYKTIFIMASVFWKIEVDIADKCLTDKGIQQLYDLPPKSFDLVISNPFVNLCSVPLAHLQQAPLILLSPTGLFHHILLSLGNPDLPSISPNIMLGYSNEMNFFQRLLNTLSEVIPTILIHLFTYPKFDNIVRNVTGKQIPPVKELLRETSLVMSNSHHTLTYPRPLLPNFVEIGGINCMSAHHLPTDLEDFVTANGNGFIYFSLGSSVPGHLMPDTKRDMFLSVFKSLPYQVVWKYDKPELMPRLPKNVRVVSWAPQQDLLGHPRIRLFITQGGMLSVQEAIYHGVPILGMPLLGDQMANLEQVERKGIGLALQWTDVSEKTLSERIQTLTGDISFLQKTKEFREIFQHEIATPQERVAHWVGYVLRHNGAHFLKIPGRNLNFYQYYLLDVVVFLISIQVLFLWIVYKLLSYTIGRVCSGKRKESTDEGKKQK